MTAARSPGRDPVVRGLTATDGLLVLLLVVLAGILRFHAIGRNDLWLDEAWTQWFAEQSFRDLWTYVPRFEPHPPLYHSLLRIWGVFGSSEAALRSLSAVFSILAVPVAYLIGWALAAPRHARWTAVVGALIVAVSPMQIQYAQEARPYALLVLASSLMLLGLAWLLRAVEAARGATPPAGAWIGWSLLAIGATLAFWTHYLGVIYLPGAAIGCLLVLPVILGMFREAPGRSAGVVLLAALLCLPNLYFLSLQFGGVQESFWVLPLDGRRFVQEINFLFGVPAFFRVWPLPAVLLLLVAALGIARLAVEGGRAAAVLLAAALILPIGTLAIISELYRPVFLNRLLVGLTVPFAVAVASGLAWIASPRLRAAAVVPVGLMFAVGLNNYYVAHRKEPWRQVASLVNSEARESDLVVVIGGDTGLAFGYYYRRGPAPAPVIVMPAEYPSGGRGRPRVAETDLPRLLDRLPHHERVWLVVRHPQGSDPDRLVEGALRERLETAAQQQFGFGMRLERLERRPAEQSMGGARPRSERSVK